MTLNSITSNFIKNLREAAIKIGALTIARQRNIPVFVDGETQNLTSIFDDLFADGRKADIVLIKKDLLRLTNTYEVPLKYNKQVLDSINDISIFRGYYDKRYRDVFTKREIYNLKQTILSGKYAGLSEAELTTNIRNTINVTKNRARLLARTETQRLRETTNTIYFKQPKIQKAYDRVWITRQDSSVRPSHDRMNGLSANKDGLFLSPDVGYVTGPGAGSGEFSISCRCHTELRKK